MKNIQIDPTTFDGKQFGILYGISSKPPTPAFYIQINANGTSTLYYPDSLPDVPVIVFPHVLTQNEIIQNVITSPLFVDSNWNAPVGSNVETAHAQIQNKATFDTLTAVQKAEALRLEANLAIQQREALRLWIQKTVKYINGTLLPTD